MKRYGLRVVAETDQVVDSNGEVFSIADAILRVPWRDAVMYVSTSPHQYCTKPKCPLIPWLVLTTAIAKHPSSFLAYFRGYAQPNRYFEFEGYRYWVTSAGGRGGVVMMINRCTFASCEPPRRVDQGAVSMAAEWSGPAWELNGTPYPAWYRQDANGKWTYIRALDPYRTRKRRDPGLFDDE